MTGRLALLVIFDGTCTLVEFENQKSSPKKRVQRGTKVKDTYFKNRQSSLAPVALLTSERVSNGLVDESPDPAWIHSLGIVVAFWMPATSSGG